MATVIRFDPRSDKYVFKWIENNQYMYKRVDKVEIDELNMEDYGVGLENAVRAYTLDKNEVDLFDNSRKSEKAKIYLDN